MTLGEPDRSGRRRPIPVEGSDFELAGLPDHRRHRPEHQHPVPLQRPAGAAEQRGATSTIDGSTMQASETKIFAGGDCVTGPATVIEAVAAGRRAAWAMDQFVTRGYVRGEPAAYNCSRGSLEDLPQGRVRVPAEARAAIPMPRPSGRRAGHRLRPGRDRLHRGGGARRGGPLPAVRLQGPVRLRPAQGGDQAAGDLRRAAAPASARADRARPPVHHPRPQQVHLLRTVRRGLCGDRGSRACWPTSSAAAS